MNSKFLSLLFSEAEFPAPVGDYIVSRYAHRYLVDIALSLEMCRTELFQREVVAETVCMLLHSSRNNVLNAVLDTDECRATVLSTILTRYHLSDADQVRFASRDVPTSVAEAALDKHFTFAPARALLLAQTTRTKDKCPRVLSRQYPFAETEALGPSSGRYPRTTGDVSGRVDVPLDAIDWGTAVHLGPLLSGAFGDGESVESLRQWKAFFALAPSAGEVPLKTVVSTAKALVRAT